MSTPHRLQVKLFFQEGEAVPVKAFVPVFHRWIQQQALDDLLIDVHDYSHMHHGPGILLIAHESDFSIDLADGRTGLIYRRKRSLPENLQDLLRLVLRQVVRGALLIEHDKTLPGTVRFQTDEIEISFLDRLRFPNEDEVYGRVQADLSSVIDEVYGEGNAVLQRVANDAREPLTVRVQASSAPPLEALGATHDLLSK